MQYRINILALIGALIGIISIFTPWITLTFIVWSSGMNLINILNVATSLIVLIGALLFVVGSLLSLITPFGAFIQLCSIGAFLLWFIGETGDMPGSIGFYLGITSVIVVFIGMIKPVGVGYGNGRPIGAKGRLLNFSKIQYQQYQPPQFAPQVYSQPMYQQPLPPPPTDQPVTQPNCKKCGAPKVGEYCPVCGEKFN